MASASTRSSTQAFPGEASVTHTGSVRMFRWVLSVSLRSTEVVVKTLLDERYAPITSSAGFFQAPLSEAAHAWCASLKVPLAALEDRSNEIVRVADLAVRARGVVPESGSRRSGSRPPRYATHFVLRVR